MLGGIKGENANRAGHGRILHETPVLYSYLSSGTLGKWSAQNVKNDWTTLNLDLSPICKDAGVYVLEFVPDGGKELEVQSINLLSRGQKLDNTVRRRNFWGHGVYDLTISEENSQYALQAVVRLPLDAPSHGRLMITRR